MASMDAELTRDSVLNQIGPGFSEADARAIVELGPEASIFAILTLAKRVAELSGLVGKADPSTPSGQMATFLKRVRPVKSLVEGVDSLVGFESTRVNRWGIRSVSVIGVA